MAIDAHFEKAVPLIEYAKQLDAMSLERAFIETFTEESDLLRAMPFKKIPQGGKFRFYRTAELPDVQHRALNEPGNVSHGRTTKFEEGVFIMDEYVKVDRRLVDENGSSERARQVHLKTIAMSQNTSREIIKASTLSDPREPNGLQARATRTDINLFHNALGANGAALSLLNLDTTIAAVNRPTHIIIPYAFRPRFQQAARSPTLTNSVIQLGGGQGQGALDRGVPMSYNGIPILWGYEPDDSPPLLAFDEVAYGGGDPATGSIYVVSLGEGKLHGIEDVPLTVTDQGILPDQPLLVTHIKWDWGLAEPHPRSFARLDSITNAAIVA